MGLSANAGSSSRGKADGSSRSVAGAGAWSSTPEEATPERPHALSQAFVQLFEWSWDDVAEECEAWLGPKGFTAVLVSPPTEHIVGDGWYTRYQPVSYNLTSRSGNESQFVSMIQRCRKSGVGIYVDAVFNQCAAMGGVGIAGSVFGYRTYPMFGPEDFHHLPNDPGMNCGVHDYQDQHDVQYCDLEGMPDLCTGCPHVQEVVATYINKMSLLGIAGFRVDAAKHMDPGELQQLLSRVNSSLFRFLEVAASPGEVVQAPVYFIDGPVTEFGFAATLAPKFVGKDLLRDDLAQFGAAWGLDPSEEAIVFLDNHDTQRSGAAPLTYKSGQVYTLVSIFMLAYPYGYPKVMSSYYFESSEQGPPSTPVHGSGGVVHCGEGQPWVCEHRLSAIANMVAWRRTAGDYPLRDWVAGGSTLTFCRGSVACVAFNLRAEPWQTRLSFSLPEGDYCNVIQSAGGSDCTYLHVDADGSALVDIPPMGAVAVHIGAVSDSAAVADLEDSLPLT
uniref:alpha-amylase n=1 Tax=Spumella elongata TaxID=89044 RepID=A0A7S3M178_9STRA